MENKGCLPFCQICGKILIEDCDNDYFCNNCYKKWTQSECKMCKKNGEITILDYGVCYDCLMKSGTEVLTKDGWKKIEVKE